MQSKKLKIIVLAVAVTLLAVNLTVYFVYTNYKNKQQQKQTGTGAVASNGVECAEMGKKIFEMGGNVADAAVTTYLCEGVSSPASCGIGGGFLMVMYIKDKNEIHTLNARERAPIKATADMFVKNPKESTRGGKAVAVPGGLKGIWELHQKFGSMEWKQLVQPVIDMIRDGHLVGKFLEERFDEFEADLLAEPSLAEIYVNPVTGKLFRTGDKIQDLKMAETLEVLANEGIDAFYGGGDIGKKLIADIQKYGGIMTEDDLRAYETEWLEPISTKIINSSVYTTPLPSSGAILLFLLNLLRNDKIQPDLAGYQRIIEAMKHGYGHRTKIGSKKSPEVLKIVNNLIDLDYADQIRKLIDEKSTVNNASFYGANYQDVDDRGTAHLSILAPNGDAIAITDTINDIFGAMFRSQTTGILLNDEMDDFSVPGGPNADGVVPSPNNFVIPGNHPMSSMVPTIVIDENRDVRLIIGAAGGRTITTATYYVLLRNIIFNETLETAMAAPRFHHQLTPMEVAHERNFDAEIVRALRDDIGHSVRARGGIANVVAIAVENGSVKAQFDPKRGGSTAIWDGQY